MDIKVPIFDLGGVLFGNGTKRLVKRISDEFHLDPHFVMGIIDGGDGSLYRENEINAQEFWKRAIESLGISANGAELNQYWLEGYVLDEGTKKIVQELGEQKDVYYLSDNVPERVRYLDEKYHFLELFKDGIFSYDVGLRKPSLEIYKKALELVKVPAEQTLFIDDKESALVPAKELGMKTLLFTEARVLREGLIDLGMNIGNLEGNHKSSVER